MWTIGVLLYQILCGRHPFQTGFVQDTIDNIIKVNYDVKILEDMKISEQAIDLI